MSEPGRRRVVDGALFDLYEDDDPERRPPWLALGLLAVVAVAVAVLVWRAVNTDATLDVPVDGGADRETPTTAAAAGAPTVDELRLLLPAGLDGCEVPQQDPEDGPRRAALWCTGPGGPGAVEVTLYRSADERDDAFDYIAAVLGVPDEGPGCALGRPGRHDYVGVEQVGQLACQSADGGSYLLWTSDRAPLLASANTAGSYAEQYAWWSELVDRTDATFPRGEEQALLDLLPGSLLDGCDRDADLRLAAGAEVVVTCRPERSPASEVTWLRFGGEQAMDRWWDTRRSRQPEEVDDVCAAGDYDLGRSTGRVLCQRDAGGRAVVVWTRDDTRIGSMAVGADGVAVADLLTWWERGGHLP